MGRRRGPKVSSEPIELDIVDLTHDGRGIGRLEGKTVFVDRALPGEKVLAKLTQKKRKYDEASTIHVINASDLRVEAACQHFDICGGCSLQHLEHQSQISFKQALLKNQFIHFGGVEPLEWLAPLQLVPFGYRRKARLSVKLVFNKGVLVGFRERQSSFIANIESCHVLHKDIDNLLKPLAKMIETLHALDRIPQVEVAMGEKAIAFVFRHLDALGQADIDKLLEFGEQNQVEIYLQPKGADTVHKIWPRGTEERLHYHLPSFNLKMRFHPLDFTQVNLEMNQKMTKLAVDMLDPQPDEKVLDLFCGLGNFSLPLATRAKMVVAVEVVETMVNRGYENAKANHIDNVEFYAADLMVDFSDKLWAREGFDKILIDPPRTGALEVCEYLSVFNAKSIVYVSCNPATLARDAGILKAKGYQLMKAGVMDMFPQTGHVESIALFQKQI
ncbi:MAG: 23S rRNA (uracil(1939)-C(5))-methyltransferase RlmD [Gammaproteobacteria bacterium CG22_combo_CG10-13_8_21_14_all_40_8]|nr:MAG: 23S rRNA (uracil(1939)-C(5))-methyltransferase RlmD [Gammaproteobacteria bacterium CG22_combo_CG10-13_8_21_14_all_40_8]